jgi:protein required for attachment to host cells
MRMPTAKRCIGGVIMRRDRTWIVVADGAHVAAIETAGDSQLLPVEDMHFATELPPTHEIVRDRVGRSFESVGAARHAKDARTDPHRELKRQFAKKVAAALRLRLAEGRFDHLILIAPPVMLGDLRAAFAKPVRERVRAELPQDLVKMPARRLRRHLRTALPIVVPALERSVRTPAKRKTRSVVEAEQFKPRRRSDHAIHRR